MENPENPKMFFWQEMEVWFLFSWNEKSRMFCGNAKKCGKITGVDRGYKELRSQLLHDSITLFLWHILGAPTRWHIWDFWKLTFLLGGSVWVRLGPKKFERSHVLKFFTHKRREPTYHKSFRPKKKCGILTSETKTPNTMDGSNREVGISHLLPQGRSNSREIAGNFTIQKRTNQLDSPEKLTVCLWKMMVGRGSFPGKSPF